MDTGEALGTAREQAIVRYEGYVRHDPDNPALLVALGDLYHRAGNFEQALACYDKCLAIQPHHGAARSRSAAVMISQHRFAEAEQLLRTLIDEGDHDPALLHNLGLALLYQGSYQQASEAFSRARELGLQDADNILYHAYSLHQQGDVQQAAVLCRNCLANHRSEAVEGYLAVLEMDSGEMMPASQRAAEVLKRQPDNADAALVASMWCIEQQDIEQAERHIATVLEVEPDSPRGWFAKGLMHMYRQEHAAAVQAIETALRATPLHVGTLVSLGWAKFAARNILGAERTFRDAIAADGSFGEAHGGLAVTLLFQRRIEEARREAQVAGRLNPNSLGAIWARGTLLALGGRREAGEALVAKALERPITADGKTMLEHVQQFVRQQAARATPGLEKPGKAKPRTH